MDSFWHFVKFLLLTICLFFLKCFRRAKRRFQRQLETRQISVDFNLAVSQLGTFKEVAFFGSDVSGNVIFVSKTTKQKVQILFQNGINSQVLSSSETAASRLHEIEADKTVRILFSGLMKNENDGTFVEVDVRIWFRALADPNHSAIDFSPLLLAVNAPSNPFEAFRQFYSDVEQHGELRGRFAIGQAEPLQLAMFGSRSVYKDKENDIVCRLKFNVGNGQMVSLQSSRRQSCSGFVAYPTGFTYPLSWSDHVGNSFESCQNFSFKCHGRQHNLTIQKLWPIGSKLGNPTVELCQFIFDSKRCFGILQHVEIGNNVPDDDDFPSFAPIQLINVQANQIPLTAKLGDPVCRFETTSGGKAARLADLIAYFRAKKWDPKTVAFKIPEGFVVSTAAWELHLSSNDHLKRAIAEYIDIVRSAGTSPELLEAAFRHMAEVCEGSELPEKLQNSVRDCLVATGLLDSRLAVRSSAVGEDALESSAAGQMESFLNIKGFTELQLAIKRCWASNLSIRALKYRKQFCLQLYPPVAVLVQRFIAGDSSGVLFTRNPDNGSTAKMIINATAGPGEGVVSGKVEPENIVLSKLNPDNDDLKFFYDRQNSCLTDVQLRKLGKVGQAIDTAFGRGQDLEFVIDDDEIYILQARPITTCDLEIEWELEHEFDSPLASSQEWITSANLQEVMPGPMTPLAANVLQQAMGGSLQDSDIWVGIKPSRRFRNIQHNIALYYQHIFLNFSVMAPMMAIRFLSKAVSLGIFGRVVPEPKPDHFVEQSDIGSWFWKAALLAQASKCFLFKKRHIYKLMPKLEALPPASSFDDPRQLLDALLNDWLPLSEKVWQQHIMVSSDGLTYPMVLLAILDSSMSKRKLFALHLKTLFLFSKDWNRLIYEDFGIMMANCTDVESVQIPKLVQDIAEAIRRSPEARQRFLQSDSCLAKQWLFELGQSTEYSAKFHRLLREHGHRCVRDSDIRERSWAQQPEKLINVLKVMLKADELKAQTVSNSGNPTLSIDNAIAAIKTPTNWFQRQLLRYFLYHSRVLVGYRELCKSSAIKSMDILRQGFYRLADLLTEQSVIPNQELLFYFAPWELPQLLTEPSSSCRLIAKAHRRKKMFSKLEGLKFPELCQGHPYPIIEPSVEPASFIKGIAVGQGCVQGSARVIRSLSEADRIQAGDILIVPCTDIGWTPYFCLLVGLVTEMGGLISHGAVVAREYGLPCLVGCKRATQIIKTGTTVRINGPLGQVEII